MPPTVRFLWLGLNLRPEAWAEGELVLLAPSRDPLKNTIENSSKSETLSAKTSSAESATDEVPNKLPVIPSLADIVPSTLRLPCIPAEPVNGNPVSDKDVILIQTFSPFIKGVSVLEVNTDKLEEPL